MRTIRVLIADDEVTIRRLISEVLEAEPGLMVAGVAPNRALTLAKIPQVNPDIVLLDLEMDGPRRLQTLTGIRETHPSLPVIMLGSTRENQVDLTLEALALGAQDYFAKPENTREFAAAKETVRKDLVPKIRMFFPQTSERDPMPPAPAEKARPRKPGEFQKIAAPGKRLGMRRRVDILAIGVSTGGPNALARLLPEFPEDFPAPIVIVQHMPPYFTKLLAQRLDGKTAIKVVEACPGDVLRPGMAWLAPGNYHMVVKRQGKSGVIQTHQGAPVNSCRPAADVLFMSVAEAYGAHSLAAVLTGMGQDGLRGCEAIYEAGGQVLVQDERTSVVWGMPGFVSRAGLADEILPLDQMGAEIRKRATQDRAEPASAWAKN